MHRATALLLATLILAPLHGHAAESAAKSLPPPDGWRIPTQREVALPAGAAAGDASFAIGDFDGDGREDIARMLIRNDNKHEGLWVHLGSRWERLDASPIGSEQGRVSLGMYIETRKPGVIAYRCFDDAPKACDVAPGTPEPKLRLRDPAIAYYRFASAESLYFWSRKHRKFLRVWTSD